MKNRRGSAGLGDIPGEARDGRAAGGGCGGRKFYCAAILAGLMAPMAPMAAMAGTYTPVYSSAPTTDVATVAFFSPSGVLYGTTAPTPYAPKKSPTPSIFALTPPQAGGNWTYTTLYQFKAKCKCLVTLATQDSAGNLYGFTTRLKTSSAPAIIFKFNVAKKKLTTLCTPSSGPTAVALASDGNLYFALGSTIYQLSTSGALNTFYTFSGKIMGEPTISPDGKGNLFGELSLNASAEVAVYEINIASKSLVFETGALSEAVANFPNRFVFDSRGLLWAVDQTAGGSQPYSGPGTIYSFNPATKTATVAYDFPTNCGGACPPSPAIVMGPGNVIYGMENAGSSGNAYGAVYDFDTAAGTYTTLYDFTESEVNGGNLSRIVAVDAAGAAYGSFSYGSMPMGDLVIWQVAP